jgi:chromatin segregation and condensation protein Rec8/ScpA/Scc1 (kleisin family)
MKDNDLLNYIDRHKIDIMKLLEANLSRITEFEPGSSLVSKLTAEQNVERVIDKLKDHNIIELGKLLRPNHKVNGVYLPPNLRNMVDKRRSKSHVKEPGRPHLDLDELEQILEVIGLLKRSESVEAVTMKP